MPAKIASFDESFTATYKEDVKLPCLAVGVPPPNILWKVRFKIEKKDSCNELRFILDKSFNPSTLFR